MSNAETRKPLFTVGSLRCPHCMARMDYLDHGKCPKCGQYCGCSFSPTTMSDYCSEHRPKERVR